MARPRRRRKPSAAEREVMTAGAQALLGALALPDDLIAKRAAAAASHNRHRFSSRPKHPAQ